MYAPLMEWLKAQVENATGCRVYRNSLPRGLDSGFEMRVLAGAHEMTVQTIFDVGQTALEFHRLWPKAQIHSFEPVPATYAALIRALEGRALVQCHAVAFGSSEGKMTVQAPERSDTFSLVCPESESDTVDLCEIRIETLDRYLERQGIPGPDILKIDTEGFDLEVLKGVERWITSGGAPFILTEVGFCKTDVRFVPLATMQPYLEERGYELMGLYNQTSWSPRERLWFANALFFRNPSRFP